MRRRDIGQAREFDDRAEQRVDLDRAAVLDVLQHRGLVRADALRAGDALLELRRKRMPNASPTVCASRIIAAASARVGAKRQMSSSVAWVSALTD